MILLVLIALVARVDAAPGGASIDRAIRDADALTGAPHAGAFDEEGDQGDKGDKGDKGDALDGDEAGAPASLALGEDDAAVGSTGPGAHAMLSAELAPGDATAGLDAADAGATAGAQEIYEQRMRHQRPSPWGRLDVGVSWRRRWSAPIHTRAHRYDEIWLVATWRR